MTEKIDIPKLREARTLSARGAWRRIEHLLDVGAVMLFELGETPAAYVLADEDMRFGWIPSNDKSRWVRHSSDPNFTNISPSRLARIHAQITRELEKLSVEGAARATERASQLQRDIAAFNAIGVDAVHTAALAEIGNEAAMRAAEAIRDHLQRTTEQGDDGV